MNAYELKAWCGRAPLVAASHAVVLLLVFRQFSKS